jgi:DNA-binding response OmpR family regulator
MTAPAPEPEPAPRHWILLAEDDPRLASAFARRLDAGGLLVDVVRSIAEARIQEHRRDYACLVLDRLLPDGDVLELVRELDRRPHHPPIVLVSAVADEEDKVEGLRAGADDYVAKPVHLDELAVRVARLVGDTTQALPGRDEPLELGPVRLDPLRLRVHLADEPLVLPVPQIVILRTLVLHAERAVAAHELLEACDRSDAVVGPTALGRHVTELERALDGHLSIERAPRHAYRIRLGPGTDVASRPRRLLWKVPRRRRSDTAS